MARGKRAISRNAGAQDGPSIYEDLLAEAGVSPQRQGDPGRPLKRRRAGTEHARDQASPGAGRSSGKNLDASEDDDEEGVYFEDVALPTPTVQTMDRHSDDDDDEDIEFEDVDFSAYFEAGGSAAEAPKDLELNLSAEKAASSPSKRGVDRRKPITREEKQRRIHIHQTHLLCLMFHAARRNQWCNDAKVQEYLRPLLTDKMVTYLTPGSNLSQFGRAESLKNGLQQVQSMWRATYEINERGLRRALWADDVDQLQDVGYVLHIEDPDSLSPDTLAN